MKNQEVKNLHLHAIPERLTWTEQLLSPFLSECLNLETVIKMLTEGRPVIQL